ncbi:hypothetical protein ABPG74_001624 [Tetrahymena malaccensis]
MSTTFNAVALTTENEVNVKVVDKFLDNVHNKRGVDISFSNINYTIHTKNGKRKILNNLSGVCKSGTVTAILGPSGGGKTSLLNVLSRKIKANKQVELSGDVMANGQTFSNQQFAQFSGYVMQNDILFETLTVKECLHFAADLKLEGDQHSKNHRVKEMIHQLKLEKCQNTQIGGHFVRGISGGERKRVNIGQELITNPSVIFLDEPTSGLDSFTAYIVCSILRDFAKQHNKTVIMSIHQPNTDIWNLFDQVFLLVQGNYIYQGPVSESISYFKTVGLECPVHQCPPDFFMSYMTAGERNEKLHPNLIENYKNVLAYKTLTSLQGVRTDQIEYSSLQTSFWYQVKKVASRNLKQLRRNPLMVRSRLVQTIFMSLFIGLVYLNQPTLHKDSNPQDAFNRKGVLFTACMANFMASQMGVVLNFPLEKPVFLREENTKYYSTFSYLIGKLCLEYLLLFFFPVIYSSIMYFMVGLNDTSADHFFFFVLICILMGYCGATLGLISGSAFNSIRTITAVQPLFMLPFVLFSGFFKNRKDFAAWIGWIEFLSPFKYALEALVTNEFENIESPVDMIATNDYTIGKWHCALIVFGFFIGFVIIATLTLHSKRGTIQ